MLNAQNLGGLAIAAGIALLLTLTYFLLTHTWMSLANPIPGTVAIVAGVIGFAVASAIDSRRLQTRKTQDDRQEDPGS